MQFTIQGKMIFMDEDPEISKKGKHQYNEAIKHLRNGNLAEGQNCMEQSLKVFKEGYQTSTNKTKRLERCISYLNDSIECLPFVIDVLRKHTVLPKYSDYYSGSSSYVVKANQRLSKSIAYLEEGDLITGVDSAKSAIKLLCKANDLNRCCEHPFDDYRSELKANQFDIKRITQCIKVLNSSNPNLTHVSNCLSGNDILQELKDCKTTWTMKKGRFFLRMCTVELARRHIPNAHMQGTKALELFKEARNLHPTAINTKYNLSTIENHITILEKSLTYFDCIDPCLPFIYDNICNSLLKSHARERLHSNNFNLENIKLEKIALSERLDSMLDSLKRFG